MGFQHTTSAHRGGGFAVFLERQEAGVRVLRMVRVPVPKAVMKAIEFREKSR